MTQKNTWRSYTRSCTPKGFTRPSSSRKVLVRDIGAADTLYPAHQHCGVTERVAGFTLVELLVVVLIIGILAAVALPQYNKAVKKARLTEWMSTTNALSKAIDVYLLENDYPSANTYFTGDGGGSVNYVSPDVDMAWESTPDHTNSNNRLGTWQAICLSDRCEICVDTSYGSLNNWLGGKTICAKKWPDQYGGVWVLSTITGDSNEDMKLVCQLWAGAYGTERMTTTRKTKCAELGVQ